MRLVDPDPCAGNLRVGRPFGGTSLVTTAPSGDPPPFRSQHFKSPNAFGRELKNTNVGENVPASTPASRGRTTIPKPVDPRSTFSPVIGSSAFSRETTLSSAEQMLKSGQWTVLLTTRVVRLSLRRASTCSSRTLLAVAPRSVRKGTVERTGHVRQALQVHSESTARFVDCLRRRLYPAGRHPNGHLSPGRGRTAGFRDPSERENSPPQSATASAKKWNRSTSTADDRSGAPCHA